MKHKYAWFLAAALPFTALAFDASAQSAGVSLPNQTQEHVLVTSESEAPSVNTETLSGIHLHPVAKGAFQLDFAQELKEDAILSITNKAGKKVFTKPVSIADEKYAWSYNVGKLVPGTYQVQVKTSDTTYWTSFKVSNSNVSKSKVSKSKSKRKGR